VESYAPAKKLIYFVSSKQHFATLFVLISGLLHSHGQGLQLLSSEIIDFEFTSLPQSFTIEIDQIGISLPPPPRPPYGGGFGNPQPIVVDSGTTTSSSVIDVGSISILFRGDLLDPGESLTVQLFENNLSEAPMLSQSFIGNGSASLALFAPGGWSDLQGIVRITMNAGTVQVGQLKFSVTKSGIGHQGTIEFVPITPVPSGGPRVIPVDVYGPIGTDSWFAIKDTDTDGDGVPDDRDHCPDTPRGQVVDVDGCSIDQLAPCDRNWRNHGEFVRHFRAVIANFYRSGLVTAETASALVRLAAQSECGDSASDRDHWDHDKSNQ
jgi:hypothetical protein